MTQNALHDRIKADLNTAFRASERAKTDLLRSLLGDATTEVRKKEDRLPNDLEMIAQLRKFVANAKANAASYEKLGRPEAAEAALNEIAILAPYLPAEVSEADVRAVLADLIASGKVAAGNAGIGLAMKALKEKFGNAFDGKALKPLVEQVLTGDQK
nr:GatB/YqeY domain-containing protein [Neorhizobium tomejilense]